jgi:hypothetical protein
MRRDCKRARVISAAIGIPARRLEGWSLRELAKLAGPGRARSADLAARRLAAHGFLCSRLGQALLNETVLTPENADVITVDLSTEDSTDEAFREYEVIANEMVSTIDELSSPMRQVVQKFRKNAFSLEPPSGWRVKGLTIR